MGSFINNITVSFACLFLVGGCVPSFRPQEKEQNRINVKNGTFVLIDHIGTLDSEFPSEVYFISNKDSVLVYKGYGIKNMSVKDDTLAIYSNGETLHHLSKIDNYIVISYLSE